MDEQGGSRAGNQDFALREAAKKTIEKAHVTCTHFSVFYKDNCKSLCILAGAINMQHYIN